jgi:hypothetical protein
MTMTFDGDLDLEYEFGDDELIADYDSPFQEEDFEALGIQPAAPTPAKPGSEDKVTMLAARYAAGLPLWHTEDCYDHGPAK